MSKPNWVAEYNCVCGVTLKSVTPAAIDSHLKGRRHAEAIAAPAPDFQDYTCDCGRKMYHVKQTQIDQHRAGRECREKLASLQGAAVLDSVVESVPRDYAHVMSNVCALWIDSGGHLMAHSSASKGHLGGLSAPRAHACLHDVR